MEAYAFPDIITILRTIIVLAAALFTPGFLILRNRTADKIELYAASIFASVIILAFIASILALVGLLNFFALIICYAIVFVIIWKLNN